MLNQKFRHTPRPPFTTNVSRRRAVALVAALGAIPAAMLLTRREARAQGKAPKSAVRYQPTPMNEERCSNCLHFMPGPNEGDPGTCAVVAGEVAPDGWCSVYAEKP